MGDEGIKTAKGVYREKEREKCVSEADNRERERGGGEFVVMCERGKQS